MSRFRKKPVEIDAVRLTREVTIKTLEGKMIGHPGDWLITGIKGEQYPCRNDIFRASYEPADGNSRAIWEIERDDSPL